MQPRQLLPSTIRLSSCFTQGQAEPVLRCDFSALPTAIVQAYRLAPRSDELACFIPLLDKTMRHSMALPAAGAFTTDNGLV